MEAGFSISLTIAGRLSETRDFSIQKAFFDKISGFLGGVSTSALRG
jgi:hypothetical protein